MSHPRLPRAPVKEALIDLQVAEQVDPTSLAKLHDVVRADFPERRTQVELQALFDFSATSPSAGTSAGRETGYAFWSSDKRRVIQARHNGLSFSQLEPYERWEPVRDEARRHWAAYRSETGVRSVTRVGLRYVNRIELPRAGLDFDEYFRTFVRISAELPQQLVGFFNRIVIPIPPAFASVTQVLDEVAARENTPVIPVVLDIEVYADVQFDSGSEEIWQLLEEMRTIKNRVFFGSLTTKALELFQ